MTTRKKFKYAIIFLSVFIPLYAFYIFTKLIGGCGVIVPKTSGPVESVATVCAHPGIKEALSDIWWYAPYSLGPVTVTNLLVIYAVAWIIWIVLKLASKE